LLIDLVMTARKPVKTASPAPALSPDINAAWMQNSVVCKWLIG
jgi:hypothetical protein